MSRPRSLPRDKRVHLPAYLASARFVHRIDEKNFRELRASVRDVVSRMRNAGRRRNMSKPGKECRRLLGTPHERCHACTARWILLTLEWIFLVVDLASVGTDPLQLAP